MRTATLSFFLLLTLAPAVTNASGADEVTVLLPTGDLATLGLNNSIGLVRDTRSGAYFVISGSGSVAEDTEPSKTLTNPFLIAFSRSEADRGDPFYEPDYSADLLQALLQSSGGCCITCGYFTVCGDSVKLRCGACQG